MSLSTVTSEALQLKLRQLLPSQQGFGTDLSASDTIIPVVDLTAAAEGSDVRETLQTAISFGSQTTIEAQNSTVVIANTPGFYRIIAASSISADSGDRSNKITLSDGVSTKTIWKHFVATDPGAVTSLNFEITVFLGTGESVSVVSNNTDAVFSGSVRQVADINGTLVQPVGFNPQ